MIFVLFVVGKPSIHHFHHIPPIPRADLDEKRSGKRIRVKKQMLGVGGELLVNEVIEKHVNRSRHFHI